MKCLFGHKWGRWEDYLTRCTTRYISIFYPPDMREKGVETEELWQKRYCQKCGKRQDREIKR